MFRSAFLDLKLTRDCESLRNYTFVTSTREPLKRARSAYAEVGIRSLQRRVPNRSYYAMSRASEPERFLAFLDDVFGQRFLNEDYVHGSMPQHAEPAFLLRTAVSLSAPVTLRLLRTERLLEDWRGLLRLVRPGSRLPDRLNRAEVGRKRARAEQGLNAGLATFNMTLEATCRVCALYRREYVCFGYPFPPECAAYEAEPVWPAGYTVVDTAANLTATAPQRTTN